MLTKVFFFYQCSISSLHFKRMNRASMIKHLLSANDVAIAAAAKGHHPFGAILVHPNHRDILLTQGNVSTVKHAESELVRAAAEQFSSEFLWNCTLVTTVEPCAMCAATSYWANVGCVVFGISEETLLKMTGNHSENPTLNLPCRRVFDAGQKKIQVFGPFNEVEEEIVRVHKSFWSKQ